MISVLLAVVLILIVIAIASGVGWFSWVTIHEQAIVRRTLDIEMLLVKLPKDLGDDEREEGVGEQIKERIAVAEQWLSTLASLPTSWFDHVLYGRPIVVFEIVANQNGTIEFYVGTERRFLDHLEKQVYAFYPDAEVLPAADFTIFDGASTRKVATLRLKRTAHLPIATYLELEADPMQSLTGALAKIQAGDGAVIQYVCRPSSEQTRRRGRRAAIRTTRGKQGDVAGGSLFAQASKNLAKSAEEREQAEAEGRVLTARSQQRVELVEQKITQQQFDVNVRLAVATRLPEEAERVLNGMIGSFAQYEAPDLNAFRVSTPKQKGFMRDLIFRVPRQRTSSTLSTTELTSLFHFPLATTATPNISWRGAKVAPAPPDLGQMGVQLGDNVYRGQTTPVFLAPDDRRRHLYLIGQTGTGKTTLFLNMIVQDIRAGHGVAVVDPHGDLIEDILLHIPPERQEDVILFDPRDADRPLGFNILESRDPGQKDLVVNEVVEILQKLAARLNPESIGPMFEHYLRNALMALVEDSEATLVDVPRMFVDKEFRDRILVRVTDPTVRQFWEQEYEQSQRGQMSADMLSYVISKLGRFIGNSTVRNIIGQAHSSFDVREIMDQQKILLCNLSKGQLGDINADLLGFVLVSKIQIAALGRANVSESQRPDFYLYLDEFQNFTTDSIAVILSEARKYRLNLNLTHQFIQQLEDNIKEAVFGNVGTVISYRVGVEDAEFLAQQFAPVFSEYDLVNLERFTAVTRLLWQGTPTRPFSLRIPPPPTGGDTQRREALRAYSRERYGRSRSVVEEDLLQRFQLTTKPPKAGGGADDDYLSESLFDIS